MIKIIIWFVSYFCVCQNPTHTIEDHGDCPLEHVNSLVPGPGGETGGGPKPPVAPPPPSAYRH